LKPEEIDFDASEVEQLSIQRIVRKRKGIWWQLPKDLKTADEESDE
jgi:hypothetical protein